MERNCNIESCNKKHLAKWYCQMHYLRDRIHGDPLFIRNVINKRTSNPMYTGYIKMKQRCYNIRNPKYKNYGWRWIKVCDRRLWKTWFNNFYDDMWDRPEWTSLDRINNDWNYEPTNCRRATAYQQAHNRTNSNRNVWVSFDKTHNWWMASLMKNRKRLLNTWFKTEEEAINARKTAEKRYVLRWE